MARPLSTAWLQGEKVRWK